MAFDFQRRSNGLLIFMYSLGIWPHHGSFFGNYYLFYAFFTNVLYNLNNIAEAAYIAYHYDNLNEWTSSGLVTLTEFMSNAKAFCVVFNKKNILEFNKTVTKPSFQPKNSEQMKKICLVFKIFDAMYYFHFIGPALTCILFLVYPLIDKSGNLKLPYNAVYPFNYTINPYYQIVYLHQAIGSYFACFIQVGCDLLVLGIIAVIICQLEILSSNLQNILSTEKSQMEIELRKCINHQKDIIYCFEKLSEILNIYLLIQFITSTTAVCLTVYQLSEIPFSTQFLSLLSYASAVIFQLFLFCWWGNQLIFKSLEVSDAAYQSNWIEASPLFKNQVKFLISRSQKPLELSAIGFFKLSLSSFVLIMKNSYSIFAVLRHTHV